MENLFAQSLHCCGPLSFSMKSYLSLWDSLNKLEVIVISNNQIIGVKRLPNKPSTREETLMLSSTSAGFVWFISTKWIQLAGIHSRVKEFFPCPIKSFISWNAHCHNSQYHSGHFIFVLCSFYTLSLKWNHTSEHNLFAFLASDRDQND